MLKLSKKTEYAFMAARHLALNNSGKYSTAKEIAADYQIPYQLVAKVLQKFVKDELATSFQGVTGGYRLNKNPEEIPLIDTIRSIEANYQLTECLQSTEPENNCTHIDCCKIRDPLVGIQLKIDELFQQTTLKQIL